MTLKPLMSLLLSQAASKTRQSFELRGDALIEAVGSEAIALDLLGSGTNLNGEYPANEAMDALMGRLISDLKCRYNEDCEPQELMVRRLMTSNGTNLVINACSQECEA